MKRIHIVIIILARLSALVLTGCASQRQAQVAERVSIDTVYLSNVQYDSIYISQDKYVDRTRDTVWIQHKVVEYRYKHLRDTIYKVKIDTIPMTREAEEAKGESNVPAIYRLSLSIVIILTLSLIIYIIWKIRI